VIRELELGLLDGGYTRQPGFVYGIDVPRFRDSDGDGFGDFEGVIEKLEYVASLGASWIWLLPFYRSLRRDNGYDVDDHRSIDPRIGDMRTFERLIDAAHALGLRVMLDLIVHHTSDRHAWFRASADGDPHYRDFYVWRDEPIPPAIDPPMFPGEEASVWRYSGVRGAWYRHGFYRFEPDLNHDEPGVREELYQVAEFWVDHGVDGFRVDAAPHVTEEGEVALSFFDGLRFRLEKRKPGVVLIAEADVPPAGAVPMLAERRFDAILDFFLNNRLALGLAREDARPIADGVGQLASTRPSAWINFVRNHDELDLEQLSDAERREVFDRFAPDHRMRLYERGVRRAWAPLMETDERLRLSLSLLFALPGWPLIMAGQELGMGEDLALPARNAVRLPMQWHPSPDDAGMPRHFLRDVQLEGRHGVAVANAVRANEDPDSLANLIRSLTAIRATRSAVEASALPGGDPSPVLVLRCRGITAVHNLGGERLDVALRLGSHLLGPYTGGAIGPYEWGWFAA